MKGKLYYFYGTMSSLKSGQLICKQHQFEQSGSTTFVLKPSFDTRSNGTIKSRAIKTELPCYVFDEDTNLLTFIFSLMGQHLSKGGALHDVCVFIDEINFATKEHIQQLWELSRSRYNIKVFCYGLKTNYLNELFEASEELMVLADTVEEIKSKCSTNGCTNKATTHILYMGDTPYIEGNGLNVGDIEGEERYSSVCQECYHEITNTYKYIKYKGVMYI